MKKCEVLIDRISLTVGKGSIVIVDDRQFEIAKKFLKPLEKEVKKVEEIEVREEDPQPQEEDTKEEIKIKKSKKK